jgi:hypothetical protein
MLARFPHARMMRLRGRARKTRAGPDRRKTPKATDRLRRAAVTRFIAGLVAVGGVASAVTQSNRFERVIPVWLRARVVAPGPDGPDRLDMHGVAG